MTRRRISAALSGAVFEWVLMLLLVLDGVFSYLVSRFAILCRLPPPCLLCSRLDHLFGAVPRGFYRDLICRAHQAEISSWHRRHRKFSAGAPEDGDQDPDGATAGDAVADAGGGGGELWPYASGGWVCEVCTDPLIRRTPRRAAVSRLLPAADHELAGGGLSIFRSPRNDDYGQIVVDSLGKPWLDGEKIDPTFSICINDLDLPAEADADPDADVSADADTGVVLGLAVPPQDRERSIVPPPLPQVTSDEVEQLKRQVELDKESLAHLRRELEEERSASAVAVNEAMAMINRLQEEKAAVKMEAMQSQREAQEQAEFSRDAVERMASRLAGKEKELQALEAELDRCRRQFRDGELAQEIRQQLGLSNGFEATAATAGGVLPAAFSYADEKASVLNALNGLETKLEHFRSADGFVRASNHRDGSVNSAADGDDEHFIMVAESELLVFKNGITQVEERLKALETDTNFLDGYVMVTSSNNDVETSSDGTGVTSGDDGKRHVMVVRTVVPAAAQVKGTQYFVLVSDSELAEYEETLGQLMERLATLDADDGFLEGGEDDEGSLEIKNW